ncbi:N-acetyl-1-D-myo-inositol-2-amino-2-deoxy-alpha-D-glucopyranoside deacetylase [Streptomyces graminofaciens]|nr:N-acetyl-1-D-myo-inositol-2-amino-2-deoxy-alpha-D-glucopyranoside deacetylase [Streptomyces graminofaciens]
MTDLPARRLLLVHAHPDDESINNGATMARYAAEGARVTLVTCTLGEEGEVIPPRLAHMAPDRDDTLGPHRVGELAEAMKELGVTDHRFLGGPGRFRDSGMMGVEQNERPGAFWSADVDEAAALLVEIIREVRPQVLVTYDPNGGYGHPDHIQAHRVAMRAADLSPDPDFRPDLGEPWEIAKVYWNRVPRGAALEGFARLRRDLAEPGKLPFGRAASITEVPGVVDDHVITTEIDGSGFASAKAAAMRAHATQIEVHEPYFALSNELAQPLLVDECYELVRGRREGGGRESDLFDGIPGTSEGIPGSSEDLPGTSEGLRGTSEENSGTSFEGAQNGTGL